MISGEPRSMRAAGAEARPLPPYVGRACDMLVADGQRHLSGAGPFRALVVGVDSRSYSTVHVIALTNGQAERRFYLKTLKITSSTVARRLEQCTKEYRLLETLSERFACFPSLGVVKPVVSMPDDLSFITEEFPGRKLDAVLAKQVRRFRSRRQLDEAANLCRLVGEWLRHFQSFAAPAEPSRVDLSDILDYCELRVRTLREGPHGLLDVDFSNRIMTHLQRLVLDADGSDLEAVARHNDFRPDNMLTRDDRIVVLDFTGFTSGPRLYDFMKFWMRLDHLSFGPFAAGGGVERLKRSFTEGYGRPVDLRSPMAELLRLANLLDNLWDLADPPPQWSGRGLLASWWFTRRLRQVREVVGRARR